MITEKEASKQLARMAGMNFFPRSASAEDAAALRELRNAMQTADTPEIAESVTNDWLATNTDRPTPADLRSLIFEKNAPKMVADAKCKLCFGSGERLVTRLRFSEYDADGNFLRRREKEVLNEPAGWAEADAMDRRCSPNVFTAGVDCSCRKVASKPPAQEKIESGLMRVASSGEVVNG